VIDHQAAISAQNRVAQVEAEARQKVAQATEEAEAVRTRAKAEAEAEANRLLTQSLTPQLMEYRKLEKWDGKLPQVTGGAIPMVQLGER
jgi:prohibitin 1